MRKEFHQLVFSPSDIVRYVQSPFASWMQRLCIEKPETKLLKDKTDALLNYLAGKGLAHESDYLVSLEQSTNNLIIISDRLNNTDKMKATLDAMKNGADVIFQACLTSHEDGEYQFQGHADFLFKVSKPSKLGDYSYEPWDTKLSKQPKAYFIIQLCCYADLLNQVQGTLPDNIAIVLGTKEEVSYRTLDFWQYYQSQKQAFLTQQATFNCEKQPNPFECKDVGDWTSYVDVKRQEQDHLSKIANITRSQINKLNDTGIATCADLISEKQLYLAKLPVQIVMRLQQQARLQSKTEDSGELAYELLPVDKLDPKGLASLPDYDESDLYFDLEGYPLEEGGLEYLWGCSYEYNGPAPSDCKGPNKMGFWERWAHNHEQEKQAFIDFIDWVYPCWKANPNMHIYHYGHYEISVCKRLMGRHGLREFEMDDMLRNGVFVDLYKVIQHGIALGAPSYSIKHAELLFRGKRDTEVASGGESVVVYAQWQETPDGDTWQTSKVLNDIRNYNIDDCESTCDLAKWLRALAINNSIDYQQATKNEENPKAGQEKDESLSAQYEAKLRHYIENTASSENRVIASQLADMMAFFERQNKPMWWKFFERREMSYEELFEDADCLVDCGRTATPPVKAGKTARSADILEYQFNPTQEFRDRRFTQACVLGNQFNIVSIDSVDSTLGLVRIKQSAKKSKLPDLLSLVAYEYVNPGKVQSGMFSVANQLLENNSISKPISDFLLRKPPTLPNGLLQKINDAAGDQKLELITHAVEQLDNSFLSIQGPPGTGKTYTASRVILSLLKQGKSIAVTSNSHKAINNLISSVAKLCIENEVQAPLLKIQNDDDEMFYSYPVEQLKSKDVSGGFVLDEGLLGATAWGLGSLTNTVDYLFIDEAGQVSIAYFVAMARKAKNVVVMGDQMQLPHPVQGTHPGESGLSILDYQLQQHRTVPVDQGIFLNRSYRMHKDVNQFISDLVYEGRLQNDPDCDKQQVIHASQANDIALKASGIVSLAVEHTGNKQSSYEEISVIKKLVAQLHKSQFTDKKGFTRDIGCNDILVVAPFNYQVNELKKELGFDARVGTVDLFQGQEAPIVIVSMTSSIAADSPRGLSFLLSINRLNVAVSRAQALAIVVHSDTFLDGAPGSIEDIRRFNFFESLRAQVCHGNNS
jgi:predicted RecB family nuclease